MVFVLVIDPHGSLGERSPSSARLAPLQCTGNTLINPLRTSLALVAPPLPETDHSNFSIQLHQHFSDLFPQKKNFIIFILGKMYSLFFTFKFLLVNRKIFLPKHIKLHGAL